MNQLIQPLALEVARGYLLNLQDTLSALRGCKELSRGFLVWPDGLDRSILTLLPLSVRTRNCLQTANLMEGTGALTVGQVLSLPNFGKTSLKDLLHTVENFLNECIHFEYDDTGQAIRNSKPTLWDSAGELLNPLLAAASELHGAKTLADALSPKFGCT